MLHLLLRATFVVHRDILKFPLSHSSVASSNLKSYALEARQDEALFIEPVGRSSPGQRDSCRNSSANAQIKANCNIYLHKS